MRLWYLLPLLEFNHFQGRLQATFLVVSLSLTGGFSVCVRVCVSVSVSAPAANMSLAQEQESGRQMETFAWGDFKGVCIKQSRRNHYTLAPQQRRSGAARLRRCHEVQSYKPPFTQHILPSC